MKKLIFLLFLIGGIVNGQTLIPVGTPNSGTGIGLRNAFIIINNHFIADSTAHLLKLAKTDTTAMLSRYAHKASPTFTGTITGTLNGNATNVSGIILGANGGTGVANSGKTITLGGNLTTVGAFPATFTFTNTTGLTFPTDGTLITTDNVPTYAPPSTLETFGIRKITGTGSVEYYVYDVNGDGSLEELAAAVVDSRSYSSVTNRTLINVAAGAYNLNDSIAFNYNNYGLEVRGNNTLLVVPNNYWGCAIYITSNADLEQIKISGITFQETYGAGPHQNWSGIKIEISNDDDLQLSLFDNLVFRWIGTVIDVKLGGTAWCNSNTFSEITAISFKKFLKTTRGIVKNGFGGNTISNCSLQCVNGVTEVGIDTLYSNYNIITGWKFWDAQPGMESYILGTSAIGNSLRDGYWDYAVDLSSGNNFITGGSCYRTIKRIISHPGHTTSPIPDFNWTSIGDKVLQNIDLGAIIPPKARIIAIEIVNDQDISGSFTMRVGNTSTGQQFIADVAGLDNQNVPKGIINPDLPATVNMNWLTATHIWVGGTPGNDWSTMNAGNWTIYITYIQYTSL